MSLEWYILATGVKCKISSNRDCQEKQIYVSSMTGINIFPTLQRQVKISFQSHELSVSSSSQNYNIYKSYMAFFILSVHNRLEAQMINSLTREIKVTECILYKYWTWRTCKSVKISGPQPTPTWQWGKTGEDEPRGSPGDSHQRADKTGPATGRSSRQTTRQTQGKASTKLTSIFLTWLCSIHWIIFNLQYT